jgi:hypothetical protein
LAFYGDRGPKVFKDGIRSIKNKNLKDTVVRDHISNDSFAVGTIMEVSNNNLTTTEESSEALYPKKSRRSHSAGDVLAEEKTGHKVLEMSSKTDDAVTSVLKHTYLENASAKKKVCITNSAIKLINDWKVKSYIMSKHVSISNTLPALIALFCI